MTVADVVRLTRVSWRLIAICMALGLALGYAWNATRPELYSSSTTGYVVAGQASTVGDALSGRTLAEQRAQAWVPFVGSRQVAAKVAEETGGVAGSYSGSVLPGTGLFTITAVAESPEDAQALAQAAMNATAQEVDLLERGGDPNGPQPAVSLRPVDDATLPSAPFSPDLKRNLALGLGAGLLVGYVLAILRKVLDRRIRHSPDVESLSGSSVLAVVPQDSTLRKQRNGMTKGMGSAAEAFRLLRTNLRFVDVDNPPRSVVVTSANPGEGKSTVSSNLARVLAASGMPTVLVDADLRKPVIAKIWKVDSEIGLTQALAKDIPVADVVQPTKEDNLFILPAGRIPPNPSELLGSQRMKAVLEELEEDYFVILDAPPVLPVTDAALLTATVGGAIIVVRTGKTYKEQLLLASKIMKQVDARIYGVVMNLAKVKEMGAVVYGYGYGGYRSKKYGKAYGDLPGSGLSSSTDEPLDAASTPDAPAEVAGEGPGAATRRSERRKRGWRKRQ